MRSFWGFFCILEERLEKLHLTVSYKQGKLFWVKDLITCCYKAQLSPGLELGILSGKVLPKAVQKQKS